MIITVIIIKSRKYSFYNCTCNNIYLKILNIFDVVIHLLILTISSMCIKTAAAARAAAAAAIAAPTWQPREQRIITILNEPITSSAWLEVNTMILNSSFIYSKYRFLTKYVVSTIFIAQHCSM